MENDILQILKSSPGTSFSAKEIGKRVDRAQFRESPNWARALLEGLVARGVISKDRDSKYLYPEDVR